MTDQPSPPGQELTPSQALPDAQAGSTPAPELLADEDQERDVWWGSYTSKTMLPSALVCIGLTLLIATLAWFHNHFGLTWNQGRRLAYALAGAVWLCQSLRWGYRVLSFNYRLTNRRLFCQLGFLYPSQPVIELADIAEVQVVQGFWEHWLDVGRLRIIREKPGEPPVLLPGVRKPERIAREIEKRARYARENLRRHSQL